MSSVATIFLNPLELNMHILLSAMTRPVWTGFVSLALWLGLAWQPAAAALPGAVGTFNTNVSTNVFVFPASASFACGTASITATPLPTLSVSGTDCPDVLQAILSYSVRITGPGAALIPISVASFHSLAASAAAQAGYSLTVGSQTIDIGNCYFASLTACGSHGLSTAMSLAANQIYGVTMMTAVSNFLGAGSGTAFLDPQFSFAAGFNNEAGYAFEFSPGIGNGNVMTPVPEPEVMSMMLLGLAGLAFLQRARRSKSSCRRSAACLRPA